MVFIFLIFVCIKIFKTNLENKKKVNQLASLESKSTDLEKKKKIDSVKNKFINLENEKFLNHLASVENESTFSYFTVIKVKNLNNGETKEICVKGNFIFGAIYSELNIGYDTNSKNKVKRFFKSNKKRYFKLKNKAALYNVSFNDYDSVYLEKIKTKYNFEAIVEQINNNKKYSISLSDYEMPYFAHILFNLGYLTGESDCAGGTLTYVNREK